MAKIGRANQSHVGKVLARRAIPQSFGVKRPLTSKIFLEYDSFTLTTLVDFVVKFFRKLSKSVRNSA